MKVKRLIRVIPRILKKIINGDSLLFIKQTEEIWNRQHKKGSWNIKTQTGDWQPQQKELIRIIKNLSRDNTKILDVGCGQGILYTLLVKSLDNFSYTGIDVSSVAIEKFKSLYPDLKLYQTDAEAPPKILDKYDVIIFNESLYYFDFQKALPLYKKLLKKDGVVLVTMYGSWRTKLIWWKLKGLMRALDSAKVSDGSNIWKIKIFRYK